MFADCFCVADEAECWLENNDAESSLVIIGACELSIWFGETSTNGISLIIDWRLKRWWSKLSKKKN